MTPLIVRRLTLVLAMAVLPGVAGFTARAQQATPAPFSRIARAEAILTSFRMRDFAAIIADIDPSMKAALTEQSLSEGWDRLLAQVGGYVNYGLPQEQTRGDQTIVLVPCAFARGQLGLVVVFNAANKIVGLSFVPPTSSAPWTAPDYADPARFTERDVTVGTGEWALPGTLTMPVGPGPFPVVVLVHGSGPNDRDETVGANKPFKDLAWGLASRGVAVLRYDKRTKVYGAKLAALKQFTVKEEAIDDALAAVALVRREPAIDPARIYVLGHSLGGTIAPRIGAADPAIAGLVVMAGAVRSIDQLMLEQYEYLAAADGTVTPAEQQQIDGARKLVADVAALTAADAAAGRALGGAPASYWLDLRGVNPAAAAAKLSQRILVLQGGRDYQVVPAEFERWKAALAGRPRARCVLFPSLNHLFIVGTGRSLPSEYATPGHVFAEVITEIEQWVTQR